MKQSEQELTPPEALGEGKWVVERMALEGSHVVILWRWTT
jgi:nitrogen fixation protein FixH